MGLATEMAMVMDKDKVDTWANRLNNIHHTTHNNNSSHSNL